MDITKCMHLFPLWCKSYVGGVAKISDIVYSQLTWGIFIFLIISLSIFIMSPYRSKPASVRRK